jgi:hypothetical protein
VPPEGNVIAQNVCVGKWLDLGWHAKADWFELRDNFVTTNSNQVATVRQGFQLPANSPAWKNGFQRIPFDQIGPQPDADRKRLERWTIMSRSEHQKPANSGRLKSSSAVSRSN